MISQLYPQSGGTELDGVLAVDPRTLAALLRFTGPIDVDGLDQPLTADDAADEILRKQYLRFDPVDQTERRDVLDALAETTFRRLLDGGLPSPRALVDTLGPEVHQRRLQAHARRPSEQALIERAGMDGSMQARGPEDYLMVSHQNLGNSKIDTYPRRTIDYEAEVDPGTGEASATVTVDLHNTAPGSGLPRYVLGNNRDEPVGSNVMQLSIYSRLGFQGGTIDGEPLAVRPGEEAGARVITSRVVVGPGERRTVVAQLAGQLDLGPGGYRLRVVPQAVVSADELAVHVVGAGSSDDDEATILSRPPGPLTEPELLSTAPG